MIRAPTFRRSTQRQEPHPPTTEYRRAAELTQRGDSRRRGRKDLFMAFFNSAVDVLQTLVVALGAGLGIWGVINLMEGYGNDNPGAKSQGMKQFMAN